MSYTPTMLPTGTVVLNVWSSGRFCTYFWVGFHSWCVANSSTNLGQAHYRFGYEAIEFRRQDFGCIPTAKSRSDSNSTRRIPTTKSQSDSDGKISSGSDSGSYVKTLVSCGQGIRKYLSRGCGAGHVLPSASDREIHTQSQRPRLHIWLIPGAKCRSDSDGKISPASCARHVGIRHHPVLDSMRVRVIVWCDPP